METFKERKKNYMSILRKIREKATGKGFYFCVTWKRDCHLFFYGYCDVWRTHTEGTVNGFIYLEGEVNPPP